MNNMGFTLYKKVPVTQRMMEVPTTRLVDFLQDLKLLSTKLVKEGNFDKAQSVAKNVAYIYDLILAQPRPEEVAVYYDDGIPF